MQDMFQGEISLEREVLGVIKHGWHFGVVSVVSDSWKGAEVGCHSTGCGRQMCRKSTVKITEYDWQQGLKKSRHRVHVIISIIVCQCVFSRDRERVTCNKIKKTDWTPAVWRQVWKRRVRVTNEESVWSLMQHLFSTEVNRPACDASRSDYIIDNTEIVLKPQSCIIQVPQLDRQKWPTGITDESYRLDLSLCFVWNGRRLKCSIDRPTYGPWPQWKTSWASRKGVKESS